MATSHALALGNLESLPFLHPEMILLLFTVFAVLAEITFPKKPAAVCGVTLVGLGLALGSLGTFFTSVTELRLHVIPQATFEGTMAHDSLGIFFKGYLILAAIIIALLALRSAEVVNVPQGEMFALILAVTASACLLATSVDLLMVYLSLEMVSVTSYVLVATARGDRLSNEGALKYLLFGAVAAGAMLYGISIVYGLTGTTNVYEIRQVLASGGMPEANHTTLVMAGLFILAGFGFKIASVPFHFWCPDVYQGAPTPVTAFLSVGPKAAGFAVIMRFFFPPAAVDGPMARNLGDIGSIYPEDWTSILVVLCLITMTLGNLAALTQRNMKRLLAYSSIAHAGYMLMGALLMNQDGAAAIVVYLLVYMFMNLGAFLVVIAVHDAEGSFDIQAYNGLFRRNPSLAVAMSIFLLSLIGFPPLSGFMGKLYLFLAVLKHGQLTVAVVAAVNSVIAFYYYFRVIRAMVIDDSPRPEPLPVAPWNMALIGAMVLPNVALIFFWEMVSELALGAVSVIAASV